MTQSIAVTQDAIVLARAEWELTFHEDEGESRLERVQPIPETWTDLRKIQGIPKGAGIVALLACPKCREVNALSKHVTRFDALGKLIPTFVCGMAKCKFRNEIYLDKFHEKPLYALALENGERIELSYTHANNVTEASRGVAAKLLQGWRVIGIGPAIGFHVQPGSKGSVLIA